MSFEKNLRKLREDNDLSQLKLAEKIGLSNVTLSQYEKGIRKPDIETLKMIANFFNVSTDYLLGNEQKEFKPTITEKDKKDIAKQVEAMLDGLSDSNPIGFYLDGEEIDEELKTTLRNSLQNTLEFARLKAKEKYTPKKYRK